MTITLTNKTLRCLVFVLPHESYCQAACACACRHMPGRRERRIASSLTLAAGTSVHDLGDAVLEVPEISKAVRQGALSVERTTHAEDDSRAAEAEFSDSPARKKRGER